MRSGSLESLKSLQAYRGIAAVLVLLFHANVLCNDPRYFATTPAPFFLAGAAGVPFFFVLSGYIIARSHDPLLYGWRHAKNFLIKRALRLYPLLWIVLLVVMPSVYAATHQAFSLTYILGSFLAMPMNMAAPLAVEWTLQHEVLFYALYAVILWLPRTRWPILAVLALSSLIGPLMFAPRFPLVFFVDPSHILFVLGVVVASLHSLPGLRRVYAVFAAGVALFAATYAVALGFSITALPYGIVWAYGVASALIIWASIRLEQLRRFPIADWLVKLGDASYSLYLIHFPVLSAVLRGFRIVDRQVPVIVVYGIAVAVALMVSLLLHEFVERRYLGRIAKWTYKRLAS